MSAFMGDSNRNGIYPGKVTSPDKSGRLFWGRLADLCVYIMEKEGYIV